VQVVEFNELHLRKSSAALFTPNPDTVVSPAVEVKNAYLTGPLFINHGYNLTQFVSVSGTVYVRAVDFQATSLVLDESSSLIFTYGAPTHAVSSLVATFNVSRLLNGPLSGSRIVSNSFNGSVFGEFNRSQPVRRPLVCAGDFAGCEDWLHKIEQADINGTDLGSGAVGNVSFYCGPHESEYVHAYSAAGEVRAEAMTCVIAEVTVRGGDPTTPHYAWPTEEYEKEVLVFSPLAITAVVLGLILAIGIGLVIGVLVAGKCTKRVGGVENAPPSDPQTVPV
jgi:hypothetical protein